LLEGRAEQSTDDWQPGLYRAYGTAEGFLGLVEVAMDGDIKPHRMMAGRFPR
nr:tRNA pseudouridine(55) synthase TruB [Burkholderiales bacterium]